MSYFSHGSAIVEGNEWKTLRKTKSSYMFFKCPFCHIFLSDFKDRHTFVFYTSGVVLEAHKCSYAISFSCEFVIIKRVHSVIT